MGRHIRKGVPYGGTVNDSRMVKHNDTTVGAKLDEIDSNLIELVNNKLVYNPLTEKEAEELYAQYAIQKNLNNSNGKYSFGTGATGGYNVYTQSLYKGK